MCRPACARLPTVAATLTSAPQRAVPPQLASCSQLRRAQLPSEHVHGNAAAHWRRQADEETSLSSKFRYSCCTYVLTYEYLRKYSYSYSSALALRRRPVFGKPQKNNVLSSGGSPTSHTATGSVNRNFTSSISHQACDLDDRHESCKLGIRSLFSVCTELT